ncbi:Uncharacterized protein DAT39_013541, partial [Clarias magur]
LNIINVVANPAIGAPVVTSVPAYQAQPVVQAIIGIVVFIFGFVNKSSGTVSDSSGVTYWGSIS